MIITPDPEFAVGAGRPASRSGARKGRYAAPALEKAFDIFELLAAHPDGVLLTEIAARLSRSVGEIFRIVVVLEQLGFLQKSATTDRYSVAYKLLDLAFRSTPAQKLTAVAAGHMSALAADLAQSCHLVVANGGSGLVVAREENPGAMGFALRLGAPIDLVRSCSGHVILAYSTPAQCDALVLEAERESGQQVDRAALDAQLDKVRAAGRDCRPSPITHGVTDISFPVFGFSGELVAALTVPFVALIDGSQKVTIAAAEAGTELAARRISEALGFRPSVR
jgi:DNA-binding IclR family transcriptional regulator